MRHAVVAALLAARVPAFAGLETWRDRWSERGVEIGASGVAELLHATAPRNWPARLDFSASLELDLGALTGWSVLDDACAFALPLLAWGEEEEWRWRSRLYVAWLKLDGSEKWNFLAGLYDPTWDFHALPSTAPFVRLPSRVGGEFAPGSPGLLDLFPLAAPGVRLEIKPEPHLALQAAALVLDEEYELHGRRALEEGEDGRSCLLLAEAAWRTLEEEEETRGHFHAGVGGWLLTGQNSWGLYAFADATVWRETGSNEQGCAVFVSGSIAGARGRDADLRASGGVTWRGLIPQRDDDVSAVAIIYEPRGDDGEERTAWEGLHRVRLTEKSWLQFTVQRQAESDWRGGLTFGWEL
jgi:hypothetical protein